jgi:peptidoglycan/xylan/chitin deacetylase (PgdA/CDA1 family)
LPVIRAPIFIYHGFYSGHELPAVVPAADRRYYLPQARFEEHLDALAADHFSAPSLAAFLFRPSPRSVILSFDDGLISNYELTFPALVRRGFCGTFFVVAGAIGRAGRFSRAQILALHRAGMTIGSHGLTHAPLTRLAPSDRMAELRNSRDILEQILGAPVSSLALPGGFVSAAVLEAARAAGYSCICTSRPGYARPRWLLPRLSVTNATTTAALTALARQSRTCLLRIQSAWSLRMAVKSVIGVDRYEAFYRVMARRA